MINLKAEIKTAKMLKQALETEEKRSTKAGERAIRIEGYERMRQLQSEIRAGRPGGKRFKPLSYIASLSVGKYRKTSRPRSRALSRMSNGVRYNVKNKPFEFKFGFIRERSSGSWVRLAKAHQEGFSRPVSKEIRESFVKQGATYKTAGVLGSAYQRYDKGAGKSKYFFLRKETTRLETPERQMVDPFINKYRADMIRGIREKYRRKMRGEYI